MGVLVGKRAPNVVVDAYVRGERDAQQLYLEEFLGKWVVLFFYPRDFTFVCPTEIQEFARLHDDFRRERAIVVGASTDSYFAHKAWYESDPRLKEVNFPIIADTTLQFASAFDVLMEDGRALRGTFIIDPNGIVRHQQVNDHDVGRNIEETLRLLKAYRTGELCPAAWQEGEITLTAKMRQEVVVP